MRKAIQRVGACVIALQWLIVLAAFPAVLIADDCRADRSRLQDCLRSEGYAQGIATTVSVIATILVNGTAIQTLVLQRTTVRVKPGEKPPEDKEYRMEVMTQDKQTTVDAGTGDPLWIYAWVTCTDTKVNTAAITAAITFGKGGENLDWINVSAPTMSGSYRAAAVTAAPPREDAELQPGQPIVYAYAHAEGKQLTAPVKLDIALDDYEMEFS